MSQVSKYPVSKEVYKRMFDIFLDSFASFSSRHQISGFLSEFLSPTEQIMLAKRLAIAFMLAKEYDYREISVVLRVSTSTIGRVAMSYKLSKNYREMIQKLLKDEKVEEFWVGVGAKVAKLLASGRSKSGSWMYMKQELERRKGKIF